MYGHICVCNGYPAAVYSKGKEKKRITMVKSARAMR